MSEDDDLARARLTELRRIRDALEVIAGISVAASVIGLGFSGLFWPRLEDLSAIGVGIFAFASAAYVIKSIRRIR